MPSEDAIGTGVLLGERLLMPTEKGIAVGLVHR